MFLKENHKPRIITTLNETITNEQANELLWKVIYFDNFINFNDEKEKKCFTGFVPNQYGNTIFVLENGEYKSKSRRPLIPFWYDDKYFYCWSLQGADITKYPPDKNLKKNLYFLKENPNENALPNKDSYIYLNKIIKIDKKYLYDAINKNHLCFLNTGYLNLETKSKMLIKAINAVENSKNSYELHTLIIFREIYNDITKKYESIDNLFYDINELKTNSKGQKYLNMSIVEYVGELKFNIPNKSMSYNVNKYMLEDYQRKYFEKNVKKLDIFPNIFEVILFESVNNRILKMDDTTKQLWFNSLDYKENNIKNIIIESDIYRNANETEQKLIEKRFDDTFGVNIIGDENIEKMKKCYTEGIQNSYKEQTLKNSQNLKESSQSENDKNHLKRFENEFKNKNAIGFDNVNQQKEILDKKNEQVKNDDQKNVIEKENKTKENNETNKQVLLNDIEHNQKKEMEKQQKDKLMKENKKLDDNAKNKDEQLKKEQKEKDELKKENEKLKNKKNEEEKKKEEKDKKKVIVKPKKKNNLNITKKSTSNKKKLKQNLDETRKTRNQKEKELKNENNKNNIQKLKKDIRELKAKEQRISIELDKLENRDDEKEEKSKGNERERSLFD